MYSKLNSWASICKKLGIDPKALPDVSLLEKEDAKYTMAAFKAKKIADAVNLIDKEAGNEDKPIYLPYFIKEGRGGFSFYATDYGDWNTNAGAAARLCFKTRAGAKFAGEMFLKIYKDLIE